MAVTMDMGPMREFAQLLKRASGEAFKKELKTLMNALGLEFLRVVQDEILARDVVVTRLLLNSFGKGGEGNIWKSSDGGLTLDVGSGVEYARFVNDGHYTTPAGAAQRFVPGSWQGGRFVYEQGAKTGMLLKRKWVRGRRFWEAGIRHFEPIMEKTIEQKIDEWIRKYF